MIKTCRYCKQWIVEINECNKFNSINHMEYDCYEFELSEDMKKAIQDCMDEHEKSKKTIEEMLKLDI